MTDSFKVRLKALITNRSDIMLEDSGLPTVKLENGDEIEESLIKGLEPEVEVHQIVNVSSQNEVLEILVHCEAEEREEREWIPPEEVEDKVSDDIVDKEETQKFLKKLKKAPF